MLSISDKRILIVEDDEDVIDLLAIVLGENNNEIEMASNGPEALTKIIRQPPFDLIISDFHMPGMTGFELVSEIGAINPIFLKRLLFISGEKIDHELKNLLGKETIFLLKPFGISALRTAVEQFFQHSN